MNKKNEKETKKIDIKRVVSWAGTLLMLISFGFIGQRFMNYGIDFSLLYSPAVVIGLLAVAAGEGIAMIGTSLNFRALVRNVTGITVAHPVAIIPYLQSNLYKYIPGGVMYVAGRHKMVLETKGLSHGKLVFCTVLEGVIIAIGALIVAFVLSFEFTTTYILNLGDNEILPFILLAVGVILLVGVIPMVIFWNKISAAWQRFKENAEILKLSVIVTRFGVAILLMSLWGSTFMIVLLLLGQPLSPQLAITIIGLYLLAWLAGFITPGAPSGFGIREAVMMMFLTGLVYYEILLAALLMHRVVVMIGDIFAYGLGWTYVKITSSAMMERSKSYD
ncbi:MAG: hypothetical protein FWE05_07475 [Defluviitaleaceae bacterium]|nr:hypothetical protein [Defluviitaleaceae bacterium]